jgi:hypothetical protein
MPKHYRADYKVKGDLVLADNKTLTPIITKNGLKINFVNTDQNSEGHFTHLIATVTGLAESIEMVNKSFRDELARALDLLSYSSHSRFKIISPLRVLDWEPYIRERSMKVFHSTDFIDPPDPELHQALFDTVNEIEKLEIKDFVRTALQYFRYGVFSSSPEDQYMRFWMALEIIAENTKEKISEPLKCMHCGTEYSCCNCGKLNERIPMAKKEILNQLNKLFGATTYKEVGKRLFRARDGLMHGGSIQSIEHKTGKSISELIDEIAFVVWNLIYNLIPGLRQKPLVFGMRSGNFSNQIMTAIANVTFTYDGVNEHPSDKQIYDMKLSLITKFTSPN